MIRVPDAADKCATVRKTRAGALLECETVKKSGKLLCQPTQLSATPDTELHPALVKMPFLIPPREFWSRKGCHNRIRHVDPPPKKKKNNLLKEVKLTQQARVHDPDPRRRSQVCNCRQMRAAALLECETVNECGKLTCQTTQLSTTPDTGLHLALVKMPFLIPPREFWSRKRCHNRIRHVDPPPEPIFSNNHSCAASHSP